MVRRRFFTETPTLHLNNIAGARVSPSATPRTRSCHDPSSDDTISTIQKLFNIAHPGTATLRAHMVLGQDGLDSRFRGNARLSKRAPIPLHTPARVARLYG